MKRATESMAGAVLAVVIGIAGSLLVAHWAACEQHEGFCSIGADK